MIQQWQMKTIYAAARCLGMDNEELHALVAGLTGQESIKALEKAGADIVIAELKARQKLAGIAPPARARKSTKPCKPGGVTAEQQRKVWALVGQLEKFDAVPSAAGYRQRLCGIIKKELGMDAAPGNPFQWVTMKQGIQLIDALKRYAESAERKALREGRVGHG